MAIIPQDFINAVVAIGVVQQDMQKRWIGTGFLVSRRETDDPTKLTCYLITNKHVLDGQRSIIVRFNSVEGELVRDYPIDIFVNDVPLYSTHPNKQTDVAAMQIRPSKLMEDKSIWGAFILDEHTLSLEQMHQTGVAEGSLIYALGFPMNIVDTIKAPICRLGCVARFFDAYIKRKELPTFLVDAQTFPGNSGGPIISRPEHISISGTPSNTHANLVGILSAYIPYTENLISQQTGRARMVQEENSGLTIVHPVDRIKEVVELEWKRCTPMEQPAPKVEMADEQEKEPVGATP